MRLSATRISCTVQTNYEAEKKHLLIGRTILDLFAIC